MLRIVPRGLCLPVAVALVSGLGLVSTGSAQWSDLPAVLARAGDAVLRHSRAVGVILADEACEQRVLQHVKGQDLNDLAKTLVTGKRRWRAELALLRITDADRPGVPWIEVRDVIEVDGRPLPDRQARVERMLQSDPNWKTAQARAILEEGAQYNLGATRRTINLPSIPLLVLYPPNQVRFVFAKKGEGRVDGVTAWRVEFEEQQRPTLVKAVDTGEDMPAEGKLWLDPRTGDLLRAEFTCGRQAETRLRVEYRRHPVFELRLPQEMTERVSSNPDEWVEGRCRYSNFRRFETGARILPPIR